MFLNYKTDLILADFVPTVYVVFLFSVGSLPALQNYFTIKNQRTIGPVNAHLIS